LWLTKGRWPRILGIAGATAAAALVVGFVVNSNRVTDEERRISGPGSVEVMPSSKPGSGVSVGANPAASPNVAASSYGSKRNDSSPSPLIFADHKSVERLSWARALEWWPFRPLLKAPRSLVHGAEEIVYAVSDKGGTKGKPSDESSGVTVVYVVPPSDVDRNTSSEIAEGGGRLLYVKYYPPGAALPLAGKLWNKQAQAVVVRGHAARMFVFRKDQNSNVDLRLVTWEQPIGGGAILQWQIETNPYRYTDQEAIEFINALLEAS